MIRNLSKFLLLIFLISFFSFPAFSSATSLSKQPNNLGLVGYWPLNENGGTLAHDSSGSGNNGTLSGSPLPTWTAGTHGNAANFNGSTAYVEAADSPTLNPGSASLTISVWFKLDSAGALNGSILYNKESLYEASAGGGYFTYAWQPHWAWDGGTAFPVDVGKWYHAVVVYDKANQYMYKNGVQVYSRAQTGDIGTNTSALRIGARGAPGAASSFFPGTIDDLRIYNRALSATEIAGIYQSGQITRKNVSNQNLVGYYPLNDARGIIAHDFSGKLNNGTLRNGSIWAAGKRGGAINLDGNNDYVEVPDNANLKYTGGNLTLETWIKPDSAETDGSLILSKPWNGGGQYNYYLSYNSNQTISFLLYGATSESFGSISTASRGSWHHIVGTVDSSKLMKIYIDGVLANSYTHGIASWTPSSGDANLPLSIGTLYPYGEGWAGNTAFSFKGQMDDVKVYTRVLTATEIANEYRKGETTLNANQNSRLTSGLVGLWSFNGADMTSATSTDRSGYGFDGTLYNSPKKAIGKVGQGLSFSGGSEYVGINGNPTLDLSRGTIAGWFKFNAMSGGVGFANGGSWTDERFVMHFGYQVNGKIKFTISNGSTYDTLTSNLAPTMGLWYHVVVTYDGTNKRIYVNGAQDNSIASAITPTTANIPLYIGKTLGLAPDNSNGLIDEVRVYNRALSADEINQLYNLGK